MKVVKQNLFAFALFVCLPLSPCLAKVQQSASNYSGSSAKGWRVGVGAGVPFSLNSFSSFGPSGVKGGGGLPDSLQPIASTPCSDLRPIWDWG